ncbi:caspase family protein [Saccharopolyspora pogona]|uniref:caspase family protein n=1 Tax=Saccharopolyspora pogona TaxID=333966 RepID=UPI0016889E60|nr:caspase family protein [Saccharopolyspora pogona]
MKFDPSSSTLILLGASEFPSSKGSLHPLPAVKNNIHGLREALVDPEICGFLETRTVSLLNPEGISATAKAIEGAAGNATETLLVYYSGHGLITRFGDFHLALRDSTTEASHFDSLPFSWLKSAILESPASCKLLIVDCCYSGLALGGFMNESKSVSNFTEIDGAYVLTATQENELSIARPGEYYSAFTGELIKTLRRGIPNAPAFLELGAVYTFLRQVMRSKHLPMPDQRVRGNANRLQLIKNKAARKKIVVSQSVARQDRSFGAVEEFRNDLLDAFEKSPLIRHSEGSWVVRDLVRLARDVLRSPFPVTPSPYLPHLDTVSVVACLSHTELKEKEQESCPKQTLVDEWQKRWFSLAKDLEENSAPCRNELYPALPPRFERHETLHGGHFKSVMKTGQISTFSWCAFVKHALHASSEFVSPDVGQLVSSLNPVIRFVNRVRRKPPFMLAKKSTPTPTILRLSAALGMPEWDVLVARLRYLEMFNERFTPEGSHGSLIMSDEFRYFAVGLTFATERVDQLILTSRMNSKSCDQDALEAVYLPLLKREQLHADAWGPYAHYHLHESECCRWARVS